VLDHRTSPAPQSIRGQAFGGQNGICSMCRQRDFAAGRASLPQIPFRGLFGFFTWC